MIIQYKSSFGSVAPIHWSIICVRFIAVTSGKLLSTLLFSNWLATFLQAKINKSATDKKCDCFEAVHLLELSTMCSSS